MNTAGITVSLGGETVEIIPNTKEAYCVRQWDSSRHNNVANELHIILSGSCEMEEEGESYPLQAGMAILIPAGRFHMPHNVSPDIERVALMLKVEGQEHLESLLGILSAQPFYVSPEVISLCRQLDRDGVSPRLFQEELVAAKLTEIVIEVFRVANPAHLQTQNRSRSAQWQLNMQQIDLFFSPWPKSIGSEADLAQRLHLSRHQLNRIIQQNYGMSFRQKLQRSKMDYASWLLRSTDYSCYQIATLCGYTAESSFYKAFGSYFRMSPQTYRKNYREKDG